ncbi:MAG: hypothetical protein WBC64_08210, partial [Methylovirgula sp.]
AAALAPRKAASKRSLVSSGVNASSSCLLFMGSAVVLKRQSDVAYKKNTREQYEALGRFVEAFELMVEAVRRICVDLLPIDGERDHLIAVVFHHQALTAKPLFEIMRATIAQLLTYASHPHKPARAFYKALLSYVQNEYNDLVNIRNNLLHGTWFIGLRSWQDPDAERFFLHKYTTNKEGLELLKLPKTAGELMGLVKRCDDLRAWIENIGLCMERQRTIKITDLFAQNGNEWKLIDDRAGNTAFRRK